jgi:hypothetical protein
MIPPLNIFREIGEQIVYRNKLIITLADSVVDVIAFASLIVEAQHTHLIDHVSESVFVVVYRSGKGLRQFPYDYLGERNLRVDYPLIDNQHRIHVGDNNNN